MITTTTMMTTTTTLMLTMTLGIFTLALILTPVAAQETLLPWQEVLPHLDTFTSYEDMQRYFDHRNHRSLRQLDNPLEDSYVDAFNRHNEQLLDNRPKRSTVKSEKRELINTPTLIRFEMADAVEPSAEVKDLIRQYRSRELQIQEKTTNSDDKLKSQEAKPKPIFKRTTANTARNKKASLPKVRQTYAKPLSRPKRSSMHQQPANFKVQFIPFDESDAREPDEQTKALIKRMRSLDMEKITKELPQTDLPSMSQVTATTKKPPVNRNKYTKLRKPKRSRRSAPEMIKFELADAKDPDPNLKTFQNINTKQGRISKEVKFNKNDQSSAESKQVTDQKSIASKRFFVYKETPSKVKKSVSSLPHDVQNIITNIIKNQGNGKALLKYIPTKQMDYNQFKMMHQAPKGAQVLYGHNSNAYVKYVPAPAKPEQVNVQIQSVPVVEKVHYIYKPVAMDGGGGGGQEVAGAAHHAAYAHAGMGGNDGLGAHATTQYDNGGNGNNNVAHSSVAHPIVVADESGGGQKPAAIHYTYAAAEPEADANGNVGGNEVLAIHEQNKYSVAPTMEHYSKVFGNNGQAQSFQYKIYSPESMLSKAQLNAKENLETGKAKTILLTHGGGGHSYSASGHVHADVGSGDQFSGAKQIRGSSAEVGYDTGVYREDAYAASVRDQTKGPIIKIEYHAPVDTLKENYKEMPEFKQLSSLVGKSPEDQIHGLTYLLAKEMQNRLHAKKYGVKGSESAGKYGSAEIGGEEKAKAIYSEYYGSGESRPQDNKSPILFHPEDAKTGSDEGGGSAHVEQYIDLPGKLIGMAKSKQYIPVIEPSPADDKKAAIVGKHAESGENAEGVRSVAAEAKGYGGGRAHSYMSYGLSPNYKGFSGVKSPAAESEGGQKEISKGAYLKVGSHNGLHEEGYKSAVEKMQSYASKYAFGYRIRDFSTGNDFGHNQNRDLNGVTRGQYHILLPDGRIQNVIYHADDTGFHADSPESLETNQLISHHTQRPFMTFGENTAKPQTPFTSAATTSIDLSIEK